MRLLFVMAMIGMSLPALAEDCAGLAKMKSVTVAEVVSSGTFTPEGAKAIEGLPEFCRVAATLDPSGDSAIRVEVWLPLKGWNERLLGTGNGGLAGRIGYSALVGGVKGGSAVVNTDMGTAIPAGKDASLFVGHPERWADWGWRSTHEMTVFAKAVVKAFYGRREKKDYFVGCSTGGEQALMEAQRFPDDYDGIVGGAPAHNRTGVHESILWSFAAMEKDPGSYLPEGKVKLLADAVMKACDLNDGVKDGLINDPWSCTFKPASLQCKKGDADDCLTAAQVEAVRKIYQGPAGIGRQIVYPGLEKGSEFAWGGIGPKPPAGQAPYAPVFQWVFGADWDWRTFDVDRDVPKVQEKLASTLNATSADLDAFRQHGHKLLLWHGWADPLVPPGETTHYYNGLMSRDWSIQASPAGAANGPLDASVRLFMLPGVAHCGGGPGPSSFDPLATMVSWVETGTAPERLVVKGKDGVQQRSLCPYPKEARYKGEGDVNDASSYACSMLPEYVPVRK